jgi:hypothetical protein
MMKGRNKSGRRVFILMILLNVWGVRGEVVITSILDGTLTGGAPKAIELFVTGTENLGNYQVWRSLNGAPFGSGAGAVVLLSGTYTNTFVYLVKTDHLGAFADVFGDEGIFANVISLGIISGNGNDGFQIRVAATSQVVDQVWMENATDSYLDSYWYRNHGTGPDGGWNPAKWETPGNDALDGLNEAGLRAAVPFGTYAIVWQGLSASWNEPSNWIPQLVPSPQTNVLIGPEAQVVPYVDNPPATPAVCMNLDITDTASLVVAEGAVMVIYGNLTVSGAVPGNNSDLNRSAGYSTIMMTDSRWEPVAAFRRYAPMPTVLADQLKIWVPPGSLP